MDPLTLVTLAMFAAAVAVYGTMIGAGGGFVLIPGLVLLFGLEGAEAVGTGALTLAAIGISGARSYDQAGLIDRPAAGRFGLGSVPVAFVCGTVLAGAIDAEVMVDLLGLLLLALAGFVVFLPTRYDASEEPGPSSLRWMPLGGVGVGVLSGTFAIGGGLVTLPFVARLRRLTPHRAAATTSATAMMSSVASSLGHTVAGNVVWSYVLVLVPAALGGAALGAAQAERVPPRAVLGLVAVGLVAAGAPLLLR